MDIKLMKTTQEDRVNNTEYIMMSDNQFAFFFFSFIHYLYALRFLSAYAWATQMNLQTMPIKKKKLNWKSERFCHLFYVFERWVWLHVWWHSAVWMLSGLASLLVCVHVCHMTVCWWFMCIWVFLADGSKEGGTERAGGERLKSGGARERESLKR